MPIATRAPTPPKPAAKKNIPLLAGLGVSVVIAVVAAAFAVLLLGAKGKLQAANTIHAAGASNIAAALEVPLAAGTNAPIVWTSVWSSITTALSEQKTQLAETKTASDALAKQVADLKTAAEGQAAGKAEAEKQAEQLTQKAAELEALKASAKNQAAALEKEIATLKESLAKAEAGGETSEVPAPGAGEAAATNAAPESAAAVPDAATAPAGGTNAAAGAQAVVTTPAGVHAFPAGTTRLVSKTAYKAQGQALQVWLANGTELVYTGVPAELFNSFVAAKVPDVYFRMKIVGNYSCKTDDKAAILAVKIH